MGLELELDRDGPSLADERALRLERQLALELERGLVLEKDSVSLEKGHDKIDELTLDDQAIRCLSEDELHHIKQSLSEVAYLKTGNPANIDELIYDIDRNLVLARGLGYYHSLELDKEGFERSTETVKLLWDVRAAEREHQQLGKDCGYLDSMISQAIDQRDKDILRREIEIDNASQGLEGLWNKITGRIPEPCPTLEEEPLSRHELSRALYGCKVETESFQELLNERYADIQEDPQAAIQNLDSVLNESRERLDSLSLQASEALNAERAERIERQLEIQDRIAESSRQEELNHNLSQDERTQDKRTLDEPKLSQTQEIDQSRLDETKEIYDNRLDTINQELQSINEARQVEGYWDQSSDIINADMALANQLTEERNQLYQVLEQSPQEQQAYLEAHPELEKTFDSRVTDEDLAKLDADLAALNDNRQDSNQYATDKEIDELSQSLKDIADQDKSWWDKTVDSYDSAVDSLSYGMEYVIEGSKTTLSVAEGAAIGTINTFQEGFAGVSAMGVGVYVGLTEWDFDKGLDATVDIMNNISDYDHHWKLSDFSKDQLTNSENMQYVANLIHNQSEEFYGAVGDLWGDNAEEFTRGLYSAGGKIMTVYAGGAVASGTLNSAKGVMLGTSRAAPTNISLKTENLEQIYNSSRIWGQTEGSVYGMTTENASVARTFIDPKTIDVGTIHLTGEAAALFKPHEVTGIFSGIKRAVGQYKAPFGDIVFGEGKGIATFDASKNVLTISQAEIGVHAGRNAIKNVFVPEGFALSGEQYANFAMSKLWGRRLIVEPMIATPAGAIIHFKYDENK